MSYMYVLSSVLEKGTFFEYILSKETIVRYLGGGGIWDGRGEAGVEVRGGMVIANCNDSFPR